MADLSDLQSADAVKIVGASSSGVETNPANVTATGTLLTSDIINTSGVYGQLTVGTSAVELKVGGSVLTDRKAATLDNSSNNTLYWGYSNSVTTTTYAGRIYKDQQIAWAIGPNVTIWLIAGSAGNTVRISEGS